MKLQTLAMVLLFLIQTRSGALAASARGGAIPIDSGAIALNPELGLLAQSASDMTFEYGHKAPFLGVFASLDPELGMQDKLAAMRQLIKNNPFIIGVTLKVQWKQYHPQPNVVDYDGLEALVDTASKAGKLVNIALIPGGASPEWIYDYGIKKIGPLSAGGRTVTTPIPWDYRYLETYWGDVSRISLKYANDPRVWAIEVLGHNYSDVVEDMQAPSVKEMKPHGWSPEQFLKNWKIWIDLYDQMFPSKKLILVVSESYGGADSLTEPVAEYFVTKCQGRAILMSLQLNGRGDSPAFGPALARKLSCYAPNGHQLAESFKEGSSSKGTMAMLVYNFVNAGNPLFIQLPPGDGDDPRITKDVLGAFTRYGWMPLSGLKAVLDSEGLYGKDASQ